MKLRVGAYCRVSTDSITRDQENSYNSQKMYFEDYINNKPEWDLVEIYADKGLSGTSTKHRVAFKKMISDAKNGNIDLILTKEISRFARNTMDSIEYTRILKKLGVGVKFINDGINTLDGDGELRLTIMAGIAQDESRRTSERVRWGQKRRMEQGIVFGRELLGYNLNNGILSINEDEAEIVKLIFDKYLEGKGTHVIARELYESSIMPKRTLRWSNSMILKVLRNEKYVGDLKQKKTITLDYLDHKKQYNKGEEEMVCLTDHHEPIIDRETWNSTQVELNRRTTSKEQKSKYSNRYWCSGKLTCGECGNKFTTRSKKLKNGETYKSWRCYESAIHGTKKIDSQGNEVGCNLGSINNIALENVVQTVLETVGTNKDQIISEIVQDIKKYSKTQTIKNTDSLINKTSVINNKKKELINSMLEKTISKSDMIMMNEQYDGEIKNIQDQIKSIEEVNLINSKQADGLQVYVGRIKELVNNIKNNKSKEELFKEEVIKIIISNDNILEIFLTCLPTSVKIQYSNSGKNETYRTKISFVNE